MIIVIYSLHVGVHDHEAEAAAAAVVRIFNSFFSKKAKISYCSVD
jgi:hypothetical protein